MTTRPPSRTLVVDTNIVLGMALGNPDRVRHLRNTVLERRIILISERSRDEAVKVTRSLSNGRPGIDESLRTILHMLEHREADFYRPFMPAAADALRLAVPSRNGSIGDDHILALAWAADADIWSGDRDFAGTGWPSWSNANLVRALAGEPVMTDPAASPGTE